MLFYCPLECYRSRYTYQMSRSHSGWFERNWLSHGVEFRRIEGINREHSISVGQVLDGIGRTEHCFQQVMTLLRLAERGEITSNDTIYLDDFWHPGIEALKYNFDLLGICPSIYAFWWAQSVDEYDFTFKMKDWIRDYEKAGLNALTGIFVCCNGLRNLIAEQIGNGMKSITHVVGLPFDEGEVMSRMPEGYQNLILNPQCKWEREDKVIFSSRWDREKNPQFFLSVVENVLTERPHTRFVICTGADKLRSNDQDLLRQLEQAVERFGDSLEVKEGLSKEQYYQELSTAKIQFNCADQDWVSFTLLEASVAGAYPIYPYFRSFPEALSDNRAYMYQPRKSASQAANKILLILDEGGDRWTHQHIMERWNLIHRNHNQTWKRMLEVMEIPTNA